MIEVTNLSKSYGKVEAVRDVTFAVRPGEIYGLLGPNGAGKSTTIHILSGLIAASAGTAKVGGHDIAREPLAAKHILGVVPQQSVVIDELSALANCMFFGALYGVDKGVLRDRARGLLDWIELSDHLNKPASALSGGMLRRLTLVLGIIHEPKALILDEPTTGLDPQTRLLILDRVREVAAKGTAVLLTTHHLEEAERLCHRVGIIDGGRIIKEGTLAELRAEVEDVQLFSLRGGFARERLREAVARLAGAEIVLDDANEVVVAVPTGSGLTARLIETAASLDLVQEVAIKPPSLESLFIRLTGRELRE
ncbi:MAG TPA: ABC transporter ATP-binding protein [Candidatus Krumholzibacteria bacterium]|nr:ABC transporter ATP-binding protein [Candidatus Krumholzibacteria bacterium]